MKKILLGTLILIVLLGAGLAAAIWTLNSVDWSKYQAPIANAVRDATGRELRFGGALKVEISWSPGVSAERVTLQNAAWAERADMLTLDRAEVRLQLLPLIFGRIELERLDIAGLDLLLETGKDGTGNWEFTTAEASPAPAPAEGDEPGLITEALLKRVVIRDAVVVYRDGQTGDSQRVAVESFDGTMAAADAPLELELAAAYDDLSLDLAGQVGGLQVLLSGGPLTLDVVATALGATVDIDGSVGTPLETPALDLAIRATGRSMAPLLKFAEADFPDPGAFTVAANLAGTPDTIRAGNLSVDLAALKLGGELEFNLSGPVTGIRGRLAASLIDVEALLGSEPAETAAGNAASGAPAERVFSEDPLPADLFDSFETVNADVTLTAERLIVDPETTVTNLTTRLQAGAERLVLNPLALETQGAALNGRLRVEPAPDGLDIDTTMSMSHPSSGDLVDDGKEQMMTGGPLDLKLELKGSGGSVRDIMAGANGELSLELGTARAMSRWAEVAFAEVTALLSGGGIPRWDEPVELYCVVSDFTIKNGTATARELVVDARGVSLFGAGTIDLGQETLSLNFDWISPGVSEKVALPGLKVRGTLLSPSGKIDTKSLLGSTLGLGDGAVTQTDFDAAGLEARSGPERCRERLAVYKQLKQERARSREVTPESLERDVDKARDAIRNLKNIFD